VFFSTADRLTAHDVDTELDYYDARICTGAEPCINENAAQSECQGEACHTPGSAAPAPPVIASVDFSGSGNSANALRARAATVSIKRLHRVVRASRVTLRVTVDGPGEIAITGPYITRVRQRFARAGTYAVVIRLTNKAHRASMKRTLHARLRIEYRSQAGTSQTSLTVLARAR
jgi:hypothetical protein